MVPAIWITLVVVCVGIILYAFELRWRRRHPEEARREKTGDAAESDDILAEAEGAEEGQGASAEEGEQCCGLHLVCEKDSLSPMSADIIYYDDEELDRFIGRTAGSYTAEEEEEFRDVLMTLRPEDVSGWARSVTQRRLELPPDVRDELLMLVNEQRLAN